MPLVPIIKGNDFQVNPPSGPSAEVRNAVQGILKQVQTQGDHALREYTRRFDGVELDEFKVPLAAMTQALAKLDPATLEIYQGAIFNIKAFHGFQVQRSWREEAADGTILGETVTPVDRAGVYVPGGRAFYPSSLIMNVIPAKLAGVPEIAVTSPPGKNGLPHESVLALCGLLGITEVYALGGAQAVAALAFGTESIAPVAVITGPGNQYVAEAKRQVYGLVGIDSIAGPSEILILHDDETVPAEYLVRDMLSQAEHDEDAASILVTTSPATAKAVQARLDELVPTLPRANIITPSLTRQGKIVLVNSMEEGIALANRLAPEHLEVLFAGDAAEVQRKIKLIRNAGALFVGRWSSEPVGDYYAGPNHTIPTGGAARYASPLSVRDFQKHTSYIQYSQAKLLEEGAAIAAFADQEELHAHAAAIRVRLGAT